MRIATVVGFLLIPACAPRVRPAAPPVESEALPPLPPPSPPVVAEPFVAEELSSPTPGTRHAPESEMQPPMLWWSEPRYQKPPSR